MEFFVQYLFVAGCILAYFTPAFSAKNGNMVFAFIFACLFVSLSYHISEDVLTTVFVSCIICTPCGLIFAD